MLHRRVVAVLGLILVLSAGCTDPVNIEPELEPAISVQRREVELELGDSTTLLVVVRDIHQPIRAVVQDTSIATISTSFVVRGVRLGRTKITVSAPSHPELIDSAAVTVLPKR